MHPCPARGCHARKPGWRCKQHCRPHPPRPSHGRVCRPRACAWPTLHAAPSHPRSQLAVCAAPTTHAQTDAAALPSTVPPPPRPAGAPLQCGLLAFAPFDPLGMKSEETKLKELKNGRLAMLAFVGFCSQVRAEAGMGRTDRCLRAWLWLRGRGRGRGRACSWGACARLHCGRADIACRAQAGTRLQPFWRHSS